MRDPEAIGKIFAPRKMRARQGGSSGAANWVRAKWRGMADVFKKYPKLLYRILLAVPVFWILFDFVTFSFGTLPSAPGAIQVTGLKRLPPEMIRNEIVRKLTAINAENLIEVDLTELSESLVRRVPAIRSVTITKNIGRGAMSVAVAERTGVAIIRNSISSLEVDLDGMLYPPTGGTLKALPVVEGLAGSMISSGRNLYEHPSGAGVLRVMSAMPRKLGSRLSAARVIRPDYFELEFSGEISVKVDPANFPSKAGSLEQILQKIARTQEPRAVSYIDIRFQQDVMAYKTDQTMETRKGR